MDQRHLRFWAFLLLFALLFSSLTACEPPQGDPATGEGALPPMEVVVFSIGKADAILLYGEMGAVLIDTGEVEDGSEVLSFLRKKGITRLDALFLTHYDKDHVGGAADIIRGVEISAVYGTYPSKESEEYDAYLSALAEKGLTPTVLREELTLSLDKLMLTVYPPKKTAYEQKTSNNSSLAIRATYGDHSFFFAGDAEEERIAELLEIEGIACDFLKAPYHGNMLENFPALLSHLKPRYAALTCSDKNPEDAEKSTALRAAGTEILLSRTGNIYARSDGKTLTVRH